MKNFRDLKVWEKAHKLTLDVYRLTRDFPREEVYGITSQIRRASSSIPAKLQRVADVEGTQILRDSYR